MLEILDQIAATSSRNEKAEILQNLNETERNMFKRVAYLAYDPKVKFHIKEYNKENVEHAGCIALSAALYDLENIIASRQFTGNMAKRWIEDQYSMLSEDDAVVFDRVIQNDLRIGISQSSINKQFPGTIYEHPYQRCSEFSEKNLKKLKYPNISQTKMDGLYVDIIIQSNEVEYVARSGLPLQLNSKEVDEKLLEIAESRVLMGEVIVVDDDGSIMPRKKSNGYINSDEIDLSRVFFYIWDSVPYNDWLSKKCAVKYKDRLDEADAILIELGRSFDNFKLVDTKVCESQDDIIDHFRENRIKGEEGTVVKNYDAHWINGTSKDNVKIKVVFDCDLVAVGYKEGTGKYKGQLGAVTFQSSDGEIEVSIGTGFKDSERKKFAKNNFALIKEYISAARVAKIKANDITDSEAKPGMYSLTHGRLAEWRIDKSEADTREKITEQIKAFTDALQMIG